MLSSASGKAEDAGDGISTSTSKTKSAGTRASAEQRARLSSFFEQGHYRTTAEVATFSAEIGLPVAWIQSWMTRTRVSKGLAPKRTKKDAVVAKAEPVDIVLDTAGTMPASSISAPVLTKRPREPIGGSRRASHSTDSASAEQSTVTVPRTRFTIKLPPLSSFRRSSHPNPVHIASTLSSHSPPTPPSTPPTLIEPRPFPVDDVPALPDPSLDEPTGSSSTGAWSLYQDYRRSGAFTVPERSVVKVETNEDSLATLTAAHVITLRPSLQQKKRKRLQATKKATTTPSVKAPRSKRIKEGPPPRTIQAPEPGLITQMSPARRSHDEIPSTVHDPHQNPAQPPRGSNVPADSLYFSPPMAAPQPTILDIQAPLVNAKPPPVLPTPAATPDEAAKTDAAQAKTPHLPQNRFQGLHPFMHDPIVPSRTAAEVEALINSFGLLAREPAQPPLFGLPALVKARRSPSTVVDDTEYRGSDRRSSSARCRSVPITQDKAKEEEHDAHNEHVTLETVGQLSPPMLKPARWD